TLEITDNTGKNLAPVMLVQGLNQGSDRAMRKAQVTNQQAVILHLKDIRYNKPSCRGNFVIRLGSAVQTGQDNTPGAQDPVPEGTPNSNSSEFPPLPQSSNPARPTVLDRKSFSGKLAGSGGDSFYSFTAGPGDVMLSVAVIAAANNAEAMVDLLDSGSNPLIS